jgi:hypothetical protein
MDWGNISNIPLDEEVSGFHLGNVPGLDPGIRTPNPEDWGVLSFCKFLVMINILFEYRVTEFLISFK